MVSVWISSVFSTLVSSLFASFALLILFAQTAAAAQAMHWRDNAVVYGISPYYLARHHGLPALQAIQQRLPEIQALGANVIWLMPVTPPSGPGQGYDVIDHEGVWPALGTESDLKKLVSTAHALGLRVMLDMALNHSSIHHRFVQDIGVTNGKSSYRDFYQTLPLLDVPYARHFQTRSLPGCSSCSFVFYFWPELVNFNFESQRLRTYVVNVLRHWLQTYDIDGFRFDASWAISSRWPEFYPTVSGALRKIKADIVLLAEDKAGYPIDYQGAHHSHLAGSGFDWAYDWNNQDPNWISKWSFTVEDEQTVFNEDNPSKAATQFLEALEYTRAVKDVKVLRYLQNNDTPGFLNNHSEEQARFAAEAMFLLPGVPLIFYGQEVGSAHARWHLESFDPKRSIQSYHPRFYSFYKNLVALRRNNPVLSAGTLVDLRQPKPTQVSFQRQLGPDLAHIVLDFEARRVSVRFGKLTSNLP